MKLTTNCSIEKIQLSKLNKSNIKIPDCQRDLNNDRVNEIITKVSTNHNIIFRMSPIIIAKLDDESYIIDGQHRYYAFNQLKIKDILVQFITVDSDDDLKELFNEINQNTPLPINWLNLPTKDKIKHKKLMKDFKSKWNNVLSDATKPRQPQIKKKEFEEVLMELGNIKIEDIIELNNKLKELIDDKSKFEKKEFYLSLSKDLKEDLIKILNKEEIELNLGYKKAHISKTIKTAVWETYTDKYKIKCPIDICRNNITALNFDCGHIISERNGGKLELYNLRPICHQCNCSMGSKNWE